MPGRIMFSGYTNWWTIFAGFSTIYFRGLGLRSGVEVWIIHVVRKVWCYGHGKFRVVLELGNGKVWVTVVYNNYV